MVPCIPLITQKSLYVIFQAMSQVTNLFYFKECLLIHNYDLHSANLRYVTDKGSLAVSFLADDIIQVLIIQKNTENM